MNESNGSPFGFNVIGMASGNLGIGRAVRELIRVLLARGESVRVLDTAIRDTRGNFDTTYDALAVSESTDLPFAVNLSVFGAPSIYDEASTPRPGLRVAGRLNVAYVWWEVAEMPEHWCWAARAFDVLLAGSDFVAANLRARVPGVPVVVIRHGCEMPEGIRPNRAKFGLPQEPFIAFTGFEPNSDPARKNPFGAIEAFRRAFKDGKSACLVVKVNNPKTEGKRQYLLEAMYATVAGDPRVIVLTDRYSYSDLMSLYASCDACISLHRSEGLGLVPLEAMRLGKPVVATGWSGNLSYMTHRNACLVGFDFVDTDETSHFYSPRFLGGRPYWAEPDIDEAATWLRRLADDSQLRKALGQRAAVDTAEHDRLACEAGFVDELKAIWEIRAFLPSPDRTRVLARARELRAKYLRRRMTMADHARHLGQTLHHQYDRHIGWRFRRQ